MKFSIVIPVMNEEENIEDLFNEIKQSIGSLSDSYEIIAVNDGSTDSTFEVLKKLHPITVINFRKNSGQSSALDAGIKQAKGDYIFTLDGDGQNDPADFKKLYKKLQEGYDVVCGWRKKRKDTSVKKFISKGAAFLRSFLVNDEVHDAGCTLRIYKKECFEDIDLYGELHRMIPAMLRWRGFSIGEVEVNHRERKYGHSKYNGKRVIKGLLDMMYIWFWRKYSNRPLHLFGSLGLLAIVLGCSVILVLMYLRLYHQYSLSDKIWPLAAFFLILVGIQLFVSGLIAAQLVETQKKKKYYIKEIIHNS